MLLMSLLMSLYAQIRAPTGLHPCWKIDSTHCRPLALHRASLCHCYRLSTRPNCFRGTCCGLGTWRPRCTRGALLRTRHVVPLPFLSLIALVTVSLSGAASPMMPASSTTCASALVLVPFPQ